MSTDWFWYYMILWCNERYVFPLLLTRSTQRAQTSLAEADHYSHIAHCKNVEPWLWKTTHPLKKKRKKKKVLDHYLHDNLGMLPLLRCCFAHLLILQYPDHHQNLISSSLSYSGPVHKLSSQSVNNFLSNVVHRQTNRQTDKLTNATKNTRSTQKAQTSLAEADHYSHIAHCKNVESWLWKTTHPPKKKKKKVLDHYLHHYLGMLPLLRCFFAHLLILQYPDHHQNLISSSLYYSGPVHKISSPSVHNFLSYVVHRQTDKQTNRQTN